MEEPFCFFGKKKRLLTLLGEGGWVEGRTEYHRGIFLTLVRQIILNLNFVTFNFFFFVNKVLKKFFRKNLSRASGNISTYTFCVVNFIGNHVKRFL